MNSALYVLLAFSIFFFIAALLVYAQTDRRDAKYSADRIAQLNMQVSELKAKTNDLMGDLGAVDGRFKRITSDTNQCLKNLGDKFKLTEDDWAAFMLDCKAQNTELRIHLRKLENQTNAAKQTKTLDINFHGALPVEFIPTKRGKGGKL